MSAFQSNAFQNNAFQARVLFIPTDVGTRDVIAVPPLKKILSSHSGGLVDALLKKVIITGGKSSFSSRRRERFVNRG
jgi:hypothetical protein